MKTKIITQIFKLLKIKNKSKIQIFNNNKKKQKFYFLQSQAAPKALN
jgi:hypothetical protein